MFSMVARPGIFVWLAVWAGSTSALASADPGGGMGSASFGVRVPAQERTVREAGSPVPAVGGDVRPAHSTLLGRVGRAAVRALAEARERASLLGRPGPLSSDPVRYLDLTLERLRHTAPVPSPLLQALATPGSALRREYLLHSSLRRGPAVEVGKRHRTFTAGLIRFLRTASYADERSREQDLWVFSELSGALNPDVGMEIGRSVRRTGRPGGTAPGRVFRAPRSLTVPGHRGQLGALLDLLEGTEVEVRPGIADRFDRRAIRRTIGSSI